MSTAEQGIPNDQGFKNGDPNANANIARFITPGGHPADSSQPAFPIFHRKIANPSPLGLTIHANSLASFATTTFMLSGISAPNVVVGPALFYGGLTQLLAVTDRPFPGMWEFTTGNTFAATAFSTYGGFWLSYGVIYIPWFGIEAAYEGAEEELASALGIFLIGWFIITFIFLVASHRSSVALSGVFFFLTITFILLAAAEFTGSTGTKKAGGVIGCITAFNAWYVCLAGLLTPDSSYFTLPTVSLDFKKK
ncbi:hypothetical protein E3Q08_02468 [Wallemia mellicola]|uniref:FUN34-transmembrane protein n=1 Tax=Wallemia mellicola TaxID=1708541 RepID=A0AB74KGD6_9BASI|nr:hypothetical protein E3Q15_03019 [Wallemia mellicola]TIC15621.1 hypothetical protein E3Q13_03281 [Wallemia mellicola]TIC43156.1 hypothetical protein E3Q08_02468 [Wallemia mellicola]TIC52761.1 hypothetical protein E3Q05_02644 [Wallemia mellicola]TIC69925.1 hypothetical protein E3Q03_01154 [Wallemia mellicola]